MKKVLFLLAVSVISCSKDDDSKNRETATPQPERASCQMLHWSGVSPFVDEEVDNRRALAIACFESSEQLTVDYCEKMSGQFDSRKHFYKLFKGEHNCPTQDLVGKCIYPPKEPFQKEQITVWYYKNTELDTDWELIRRGCNMEGMYFSLL